MANYTLDWSDGTLKSPLVVVEGETDSTSTSLTLVGYNERGWGEILAENLLHLLENFASNNSAPSAPTTGQLWFNNTDKYLKVYYSSTWHDLAHRRVDASSAPTGTLYAGDLWYDTVNDLLKVYTGSTWIAVCAQCSGSPTPTPSPSPVSPSPSPVSPSPSPVSPSPSPVSPTPTPSDTTTGDTGTSTGTGTDTSTGDTGGTGGPGPDDGSDTGT